ncbi:MAG: DNA modification system-associated small protein [Rubricella sp.]
MELLREICDDDDLHFQLVRELLSIEKRHKSMLRRAGLFDALESSFYRNFYENEDDAVQRARLRREALGEAKERATDELAPVGDPSSLIDEACK